MKPGWTLLAIFAAFLVSYSAEARVQTGVLTCNSKPSVGLIVGSKKSMTCVFQPNGGPAERYSATEGRIGLDLGITAASTLVWAVFAPTETIRPGDIAGRYVGATGDLTLGVGAGANILVGGSKNSIALQPVSAEVQAGLAVGLGVSAFTLRYQP